MHRLHLENITREQAAAKFGVSVRAIDEFRSIKDAKLIARMRAGEISVWEAKRLVAQAELEQAQAAAKEAQRNLREKKKAAPSTGTNNGGDKDKPQPSKKAKPKSTWDPNVSKATRAYAIKTLKEHGFPITDELIERTIEEYRKYERDQAELHKQEQTNGEDDGGAAGGEDGDGEVELHPVRRKHGDYTGTYVGVPVVRMSPEKRTKEDTKKKTKRRTWTKNDTLRSSAA